MIISKTPFRVSFGGGGSDLASYYLREPGMVLSTAINKYMYLVVKKHFEPTLRISYSRTEIVDSVVEIQHPIVRECLQMFGIENGLEVVSMGDLPARTGLGSSSSFTVGLLHALYALHGRVVSRDRLALEACCVEIEKLNEPIGKQDQYVAAHGGLQFIQFNPDGTVFVDPVVVSPETRAGLNEQLLLFFTGDTRNARDVLADQQSAAERNMPVLRRMCEIACEMREVLTSGQDLRIFGKLLHTAWGEKRSLANSISNPRIDQLYERGLCAGALGGKLLGAGGGGFLLFFCEPHNQGRLREELSDLRELTFSLERQGTQIVHVGSDDN